LPLGKSGLPPAGSIAKTGKFYHLLMQACAFQTFGLFCQICRYLVPSLTAGQVAPFLWATLGKVLMVSLLTTI
jgi:hypothetical protein